MNLAAEAKAYEAAGILADELPWWGWLRDRPVCLTRGGELVSIARLTPALVDGHTPGQLDTIHNRWQRLLSQVPPGSRFYFYFLRRPMTPVTVDPTGGVGEIAQRRRQEFLSSRLQRIEAYVAWAHDPGLKQAVRKGPGLLGGLLAGPKQWLRRRQRPDEAAYYAAEIHGAAARFEEMVGGLAELVSDISPLKLLDADEGNAFLTDLANRPDTLTGGGPSASALNWKIAVSDLEAERNHLRVDSEPVALYSLLSPPPRARANMLQDLFAMNVEALTVSMEWRPRQTGASRRAIRNVQRAHFSKRYSAVAHMQETDGTSSAMVDATADEEASRLAAALVELEADGVAYGDISLTVAAHGPLDVIAAHDAEIRRIFAAQDAKLIRETYGQIPAWFSRLPGQPRRRQLRTILGSAGLMGCLAPIFGPAIRPPKSPHLGQRALATFETAWGSPLHYDLFAGDVGHTLVLGATGAGKSFLLNFLLVQALQYDPRVLVLDLGGSYRWLTRFLGGGYIELSPDNPDERLSLQPFALPPGERTFQFLTGWIARLLKIGGYTLGGADTGEIRARVEDLYSFPPERRTLSAFVRSLPRPMWPAMTRWHGDGPWARFFDGPVEADGLDLADWQVIDLAGAAEHEDLCEAALFYLLEKLRVALDDPGEVGRVKLMVVDEAWRYLRDPAVLAYLAEAAKTWRKRNAALVMATQSAVDVTGSPGAAALLESMPTKLFLANPDLPQDVQDVFRLNDTEMACIRGLIPKRELYLRRSGLASVLRLQVDPQSYWLYTSNAADAARRAAAVEELGLDRALEALTNGDAP